MRQKTQGICDISKNFNDIISKIYNLKTSSDNFPMAVLSSYIAQGTYEVKDNSLICKTDDGKNTYTFEILENGYKFIEDKSSKIPKYKYSSDAKEALAPVIDGAIFD